MAEIPIEKKSSMAWLWILLALLLVALLAWWLLADDDDDLEAYVDNDTAAVVADPDTTAATVWSVGDNVNLDGVRVTSLEGDMAFRVDANGQDMLVLFNQEPTPGDATEGEYDINVGSMVNLDGSVRSAADPLPEGVTATIPDGTDTYIFADEIEMVS